MSKTIKGRQRVLEKYIQNKWKVPYLNFLIKHEDKLYWGYLSQNPNIPIEFIEKHVDKHWNWNCISQNPNITIEFIERYPDKPWEWYWISKNTSITIEIIEKYPDKPWNWQGISQNPNITMEIIEIDFIEKYPDKGWSWSGISYNIFTKEKELFYQKYYRIYLATFRLQQYFNRMYDNPKYLFCRNRLDKLFSETL